MRRPLRRGISSIKFILALPVLIMFAWLGVEVSLVLRAANQAKAAADAIALAAAARFDDGFETARLDALAAAAANRAPKGPVVVQIGDGPGGGGDVVFGNWNEESRSFEADPEGGRAVKATVRFAADNPNGAPGLVLAGIFGLAEAAVERTSVAVFNPPENTTALMILGTGAAQLRMNGTATLLSAHGVSVSSKSATAVQLEEESAVSVPVLRVAGGLDASSEIRVDGSIEQAAAVPPDPFASTPLPPIEVGEAKPISLVEGATTFVAPGVHQGLELESGQVVLLPGLHQFVGPMQLGGTAHLALDAATIQLDETAYLELTGSSSLTGSGAADIGPWSGFCVIQRSSDALWRTSALSSVELGGTVYAPGTRLRLVDAATIALDSVVLGTLEAFSSTRIELSGKLDELDLPSTPGRASLVR